MHAIAELSAFAERIKRDLAQDEPYAFAQEWPWNDTLRRLEQEHGGKRTSLLWRRFLAFDEARKAYEAAYEQRQRWQRELTHLRRYVHQVETEGDPDVVDYAAYGQAKLKAHLLEARLGDPHGVLGDHKRDLQQAEDRWGKTWEAYTVLKTDQRHQERSASTDAWQELRRIRGQLKQYEAPRRGE